MGPKYLNVDIAVEKMWRFRERYTAQLRIECYNVFNQVSFQPFADGTSDPSQGGGIVDKRRHLRVRHERGRERRVQ